MVLDLNWRFPDGSAKEVGLNTGSMETFKGNPISGLAREICQNSIDARKDKEKAVRIDFSSFEIEREKIPGLEGLTAEINMCIDYNKNSKDEKIRQSLDNMHTAITQDKITCLRISDFNTTGLKGIYKNDRNSPFHALIHGSGITNKGDGKAGSKGLGKYASFVCSKFNTVFYYTVTEDSDYGYIGVSELCSHSVNGDQKNLTQGTGFYCFGESNEPINQEFSLDEKFRRDLNDSGTDIYILGFKNNDGWQEEIKSIILESFIVAIYKGDIEFSINGELVNKETLKDVVNNLSIKNKSVCNNVKSQYILLTEPSYEVVIPTDYGDAILYIKNMKKEGKEMATNHITMIRYPYMRIKDNPSPSSLLSFSAMCIIENNKLNSLLRSVENPQHNGWETKRLDDVAMKKECDNVIRQLKTSIEEVILEKLKLTDSETSDIVGAEEFLPSLDANADATSYNATISDKPIMSKPNKIKHPLNLGDDKNNGLAASPEISSSTEGEGDVVPPSGQNNGKGGEEHSGDTTSAGVEGDNVVMKLVPLSGMKYKFVAIDAKKGIYDIIFKSLYTEKDLELTLVLVDDNNSKQQVNVISASVNGEECKVENNIVKGFSIEYGKKVVVKIETDEVEEFSCEVKICK